MMVPPVAAGVAGGPAPRAGAWPICPVHPTRPTAECRNSSELGPSCASSVRWGRKGFTRANSQSRTGKFVLLRRHRVGQISACRARALRRTDSSRRWSSQARAARAMAIPSIAEAMQSLRWMAAQAPTLLLGRSFFRTTSHRRLWIARSGTPIGGGGASSPTTWPTSRTTTSRLLTASLASTFPIRRLQGFRTRRLSSRPTRNFLFRFGRVELRAKRRVFGNLVAICSLHFRMAARDRYRRQRRDTFDRVFFWTIAPRRRRSDHGGRGTGG